MNKERPEKKRTRWILWIVILAGFISLVIVVFSLVFFTGPSIPESSILLLRLGSKMPVKPKGKLEAFFLGNGDPSVFALYKSLSRAACDDRIKGLCLDLQNGSLNYANSCELRQLVKELRKKGKKVIAYANDLSFRAWSLATACNKIVLNPCGYTHLGGIKLQVILLKGLLEEKLGVKADFHRVGRFKTAPETLKDSKLSDESRLALKRLVDGSWEQLLSEVSEGRGLKTGEIEKIVNMGPLSAGDSVKQKLVDVVLWRNELKDFLKKEICEDSKIVSWHTYVRAVSGIESGTKIAYLPVSGTIAAGNSNSLFGNVAAADKIIKQLGDLRKNRAIKAVVIRVDSPGGDALSSARLYHAVRLTRKIKPVVVSMGTYAASGGYYLASGADYIVAQPYTLTGSIGIFGGKIVLSGLAKKFGLAWEDFSRGEFAGMYDPLKPFNKKEAEALERQLTELYTKFISDVAKGRRERLDRIENVAEGRVWLGKDAVKHNLVDKLGGLGSAVDKARELARLSGDINLVLWPPHSSWLRELLPRKEKLLESKWPLPGLMTDLFSGRPLALMPFTMLWR